jgi:hypothetical protein
MKLMLVIWGSVLISMRLVKIYYSYGGSELKGMLLSSSSNGTIRVDASNVKQYAKGTIMNLGFDFSTNAFEIE